VDDENLALDDVWMNDYCDDENLALDDVWMMMLRI
jgi:hypothetical protein